MPERKEPTLPVSRRAFLKGLGTTTVTAAVSASTAAAQEFAESLKQFNEETVYGPEAVPLRLTINGQPHDVLAEPRATLLDVLRHHLPLTGAKEVCGRASCGACTVLLDGRPVYACMKLALEAEGHAITTVEGLADGDALAPIQTSFVEEDALQCGYCTSGFLVTLSAFLQTHDQPTETEVREAVAGHLCRCGTYPRIVRATLAAAGVELPSQTEVLSRSDGTKMA